MKAWYDASTAVGMAPAGGQTSFQSTAPPTGRAYTFKLKYTAGYGYAFSVNGQESALFWTLGKNGGTLVNGVRPIDYYNAVAIRLSTAGKDNASITNLSFTSIGLSACGAMTDMHANNSTQWMLASDSMTSSSWVLEGEVKLTSRTRRPTTKLEILTYALPQQTMVECTSPMGVTADCWNTGLWSKKDPVYPLSRRP